MAKADGELIALVEAEMQRVLANDVAALAGHYGMLRYHMGWADETFRPARVDGGKRIRPLACLLACQAVGGDVRAAVPAAAAVELLHNFSLIHDDIQDDSPTRRHRPTVWALWGRPQAINAGDAMFTLARVALHGLKGVGLADSAVLAAFAAFDDTCLRLTEGQYLDMGFEDRLDVSVADYLAMIGGKTAALLSASLRLGAIAGEADPDVCQHLAEFGRELGLAFQIQDDLLGIWGDEARTGKSAQTDILGRKKSLPVVYALGREQVGPKLRALYAEPITIDEVLEVLALLERAGARAFAEAAADAAHGAALEALAASGVLESDGGRLLLGMAEALLKRQA